jgi:acetylglutamate kinase
MSGYVVIKLSGSVLDQPQLFKLFPVFLKQFTNLNLKPILVHGAGIQVDLACEQRNIPIEKINGRRVTSKAVLEIMLDLVHGRLNRGIVASLLASEIPAIGITSGDAGLLSFEKRKPKIIQGKTIDFGWVGDLIDMNVPLFRSLCDIAVPVISCLGFSKSDGWLNVNADTISSIIAQSVSANMIIMISELAGVKDASGKFVATLNPAEIAQGIEQQWITDGMIVKLEQAISLANQGIPVRIGTLDGLLMNQFTEIVPL